MALTLCYGVAGGLVTVAFMLATNHLFTAVWRRLATLAPGAFLLGSFLTITLTSLAAGILMSRVCAGAAGQRLRQPQARGHHGACPGAPPQSPGEALAPLLSRDHRQRCPWRGDAR